MSKVNTAIAKINATIIARLALSRGSYIDDHRTGNSAECTTNAVGRFVIGEREHIVMLMDGKRFCLNPVELGENGRVHLSTGSVGGNLDAKSYSLKEAVANFNEQSKGYPWDNGQIVEIIRF